MNWKSLLAVFIIVGIIGLLMVTDVGRKYTQFLGAKVGNFISTILNLYTSKEGESFGILLKADKAAFYGQSYAVSNVTLRATGICQSSVTIGNTIMQMAGNRCSIEARNAQGKFDYTVGNSIKLVGTADMLTVNDYPFLSTGAPFEVSFEVIPMDDFSLAGLSQSKIQLSSVSGSIDSWKGETQFSVDNLRNDELTISNFNGDMKIDGDSIILVGLASSVKGKNFSW